VCRCDSVVTKSEELYGQNKRRKATCSTSLDPGMYGATLPWMNTDPNFSQPQLPKKRKVEADRDSIKKPRTHLKKEKASERKIIPIPAVDSGSSGESDVDEDDLLFYKEVSPSLVFLSGLDQKAIAR
jgi:hypothetical protein